MFMLIIFLSTKKSALVEEKSQESQESQICTKDYVRNAYVEALKIEQSGDITRAIDKYSQLSKECLNQDFILDEETRAFFMDPLGKNEDPKSTTGPNLFRLSNVLGTRLTFLSQLQSKQFETPCKNTNLNEIAKKLSSIRFDKTKIKERVELYSKIFNENPHSTFAPECHPGIYSNAFGSYNDEFKYRLFEDDDACHEFEWKEMNVEKMYADIKSAAGLEPPTLKDKFVCRLSGTGYGGKNSTDVALKNMKDIGIDWSKSIIRKNVQSMTVELFTGPASSKPEKYWGSLLFVKANDKTWRWRDVQEEFGCVTKTLSKNDTVDDTPNIRSDFLRENKLQLLSVVQDCYSGVAVEFPVDKDLNPKLDKVLLLKNGKVESVENSSLYLSRIDGYDETESFYHWLNKTNPMQTEGLWVLVGEKSKNALSSVVWSDFVTRTVDQNQNSSDPDAWKYFEYESKKLELKLYFEIKGEKNISYKLGQILKNGSKNEWFSENETWNYPSTIHGIKLGKNELWLNISYGCYEECSDPEMFRFMRSGDQGAWIKHDSKQELNINNSLYKPEKDKE